MRLHEETEIRHEKFPLRERCENQEERFCRSFKTLQK